MKVRISKLSKSADRKGSQPISIDAKDEKKLSKAVQEELEKAGLLDTQGKGQFFLSLKARTFLTDPQGGNEKPSFQSWAAFLIV